MDFFLTFSFYTRWNAWWLKTCSNIIPRCWICLLKRTLCIMHPEATKSGNWTKTSRSGWKFICDACLGRFENVSSSCNFTISKRNTSAIRRIHAKRQREISSLLQNNANLFIVCKCSESSGIRSFTYRRYFPVTAMHRKCRYMKIGSNEGGFREHWEYSCESAMFCTFVWTK